MPAPALGAGRLARKQRLRAVDALGRAGEEARAATQERRRDEARGHAEHHEPDPEREAEPREAGVADLDLEVAGPVRIHASDDRLVSPPRVVHRETREREDDPRRTARRDDERQRTGAGKPKERLRASAAQSERKTKRTRHRRNHRGQSRGNGMTDGRQPRPLPFRQKRSRSVPVRVEIRANKSRTDNTERAERESAPVRGCDAPDAACRRRSSSSRLGPPTIASGSPIMARMSSASAMSSKHRQSMSVFRRRHGSRDARIVQKDWGHRLTRPLGCERRPAVARIVAAEAGVHTAESFVDHALDRAERIVPLGELFEAEGLPEAAIGSTASAHGKRAARCATTEFRRWRFLASFSASF